MYPVPLPIVLGHEGAGIVEAVGTAVQKVAPGDHVAVSFLNCARCRPCFDGSPASCANFNDMNFAGQRPDGSHALTSAASGEPMNDRFLANPRSPPTPSRTSATPSRSATTPRSAPRPLGCGIQTGAGTVLRALEVEAGATFAVTGAGAVGLSAVMAARSRGHDDHRRRRRPLPA